MIIHVYGNVLNLGFIAVKMLRQKGVEAILFLDDTSKLDQDFPWWDDPTISANNLPYWIKYYKTFPLFIFPNAETKRMISDFSKCDVAFVSCYGPILAMKSKVPFVFVSAASDLNMIDIVLDFKKVFLVSGSLKDKIRKFIKILTFSQLQKKAILNNCNVIISGIGYQYKNIIEKFNLQNKTIQTNFPKDIINFKAEFDIELNEKYKKYKRVYFMLSRHSWYSPWNDLKGNDKFIRAFARFVKQFEPNVLFISSTKGIDSKRSIELTKSLGIDKYIEWVDDMPKHILKKYMTLPNMIMVDNFWHDEWYIQFPLDNEIPKVGFGFGSVESMASKRPLITAFTDYEFYNNEEPPIFNAFTIDEIFEALKLSYEMSEVDLLEKGNLGYQFVLKWYDFNSPENKILEIIKDVFINSKRVKD